jgi:lipid A disaccharide synthetase
MGKPRIAMVAGEASGDLLAAHVLDAMRARWPELAVQGIGGAQMGTRGFEAWWPSAATPKCCGTCAKSWASAMPCASAC